MMTKQTLYTALAWLMIFCLNGMCVACQSENMELEDTKTVRITLHTSTLSPANTRVADPGVESLNENVIQQVDLFLYPKENAAGEPAYFRTFTFTQDELAYSAENKKATLVLDLPLEAYYKLFSESDATSCTAFVIANRPDGTTLPDSKTIANLKANTVLYAPGFNVTVGTDHALTNQPQTSFVMYGQADLTLSNRNLSGDIPVQRVAAKVSLMLSSIADEVEGPDGNLWLPDKEHVYVAYRNQMLRTNLGMNPATAENLYTPAAGDMAGTGFVKMEYVEQQNDENEISLDIPFYTYPADWKSDVNNRPYLVLVVNWKKKTNPSEHQVTYYEVPVNDAKSYVQGNHHYYIQQEVDVLGSFSEETPVELMPSFMILKWGDALTSSTDKTDTDATLSRLEYLVVDETDIEMHNTQSHEVFFFSSQPVVVLSVTMKHMNVNGTNATLEVINGTLSESSTDDGVYVFTPTSSSSLPNKNPVTITVHNAVSGDPEALSYFTVQHPLLNEMSSTSDYTDYRFVITIQHKGNSAFQETVNLTQYPMIPIKADQNSDYSKDGNNDINTAKGYLYINNAQATSGWSQVYGLTTGGTINANPNRYIISVTSLTNDDYIIGDPRETTRTTFSGLNNDDNGKSLQYYYATEQTDRTVQMISPEFIVASSYGVCGTTMSYSDAEKRCAAYQEDGYPAGRWRVPTIAEVKYMIQLSDWGIIPVLFNTNTGYWSAHDAINGAAQNVTGNSHRVRCVYDTWRWGTDQLTDRTKFTYGDEEQL